MHKIGRDLGERAKDKFSQVQPRVGQRQEFRFHPLIAKKKDIEVDRTGFI